MGKASRQPKLIPHEDSGQEAALELFPAAWGATEKLLSPDLREREAGLEDLLESRAAWISPLIAHFLVTRLFESDPDLQTRIIRSLADLMRRAPDGSYASDEVRSQVIGGLTQFGEQALGILLAAGSANPDLLEDVLKLMNYSPSVGRFLKGITADRTQSIESRTLAVTLIGRIGYSDARTELERIRNRIEASQNGQRSMPFAPKAADSEAQLLPVIRKTLVSLSV